jgi:hypothetical protein
MQLVFGFGNEVFELCVGSEGGSKWMLVEIVLLKIGASVGNSPAFIFLGLSVLEKFPADQIALLGAEGISIRPLLLQLFVLAKGGLQYLSLSLLS